MITKLALIIEGEHPQIYFYEYHLLKFYFLAVTDAVRQESFLCVSKFVRLVSSK